MLEDRIGFAEELTRLRKDAGLTKTELASKAGVSVAYVSYLEAGKRPPTDRVIRSLSRALEVMPNKLFSTLCKVEMDLAGTLATGREKVRAAMPDLPSEQVEELADYMAFLEFKASVLG